MRLQRYRLGQHRRCQIGVSAWREHHGSAKGVGIPLQPITACGNRRALRAGKTFDYQPKSLSALDGRSPMVGGPSPMSAKAPLSESKPAAAAEAPAPATPPRRSPGHRGQDVRDTVAEMAARAHEISLEAGSKMAAAMKDVINAAAGLTGFAVESARDLVQYMVRRGQMTQDEADKLIREAEEAHGKRNPGAGAPKSAAPSTERAVPRPAVKAVEKPPTIVPMKPAASAPTPKASAASKPATPKAAASPKKTATAAKKAAPAKGAVKRPAVAKASAKPNKKK